MGDRKRKIPDWKLAVFDLSKSFSIRKQKLSYGTLKIRLYFYCVVGGVFVVWITRISNVLALLTPLVLLIVSVRQQEAGKEKIQAGILSTLRSGQASKSATT